MTPKNNSLSDPSIRNRMKKYDSYSPRPGQSPRRTQTTIPVQTLKFQEQKKQVIRPAAPEQATHLLAPTKVSIQEKPNVQSSKNVIALNAVQTSKLPGDARYPDDSASVYTSGKRKLSMLQKAMYGVGSAVFLFSMLVSIQSFITNNKAQEQIATLGDSTSRDEQGVSEGTSDEPSEEQISESAILAFRPSNPEDPRYLRIPDINVFSRIKALGVTAGGAVDTPKNIYDTGWYSGGSRPGNSVGSALILGHVSGWSGPGVFKNINKLSAGSKFEIEKGTGEKVYYEVTKTEQIPTTQVDMSKILATEVAGQHDIKLMTCSGRYNAQTKSFDDRFVVYGKQVN
jgi:LPXTG-site transpeptidase (sortase) family protein